MNSMVVLNIHELVETAPISIGWYSPPPRPILFPSYKTWKARWEQAEVISWLVWFVPTRVAKKNRPKSQVYIRFIGFVSEFRWYPFFISFFQPGPPKTTSKGYLGWKIEIPCCLPVWRSSPQLSRSQVSAFLATSCLSECGANNHMWYFLRRFSSPNSNFTWFANHFSMICTYFALQVLCRTALSLVQFVLCQSFNLSGSMFQHQLQLLGVQWIWFFWLGFFSSM